MDPKDCKEWKNVQRIVAKEQRGIVGLGGIDIHSGWLQSFCGVVSRAIRVLTEEARGTLVIGRRADEEGNMHIQHVVRNVLAVVQRDLVRCARHCGSDVLECASGYETCHTPMCVGVVCDENDTANLIRESVLSVGRDGLFSILAEWASLGVYVPEPMPGAWMRTKVDGKHWDDDDKWRSCCTLGCFKLVCRGSVAPYAWVVHKQPWVLRLDKAIDDDQVRAAVSVMLVDAKRSVARLQVEFTGNAARWIEDTNTLCVRSIPSRHEISARVMPGGNVACQEHLQRRLALFAAPGDVSIVSRSVCNLWYCGIHPTGTSSGCVSDTTSKPEKQAYVNDGFLLARVDDGLGTTEPVRVHAEAISGTMATISKLGAVAAP